MKVNDKQKESFVDMVEALRRLKPDTKLEVFTLLMKESCKDQDDFVDFLSAFVMFSLINFDDEYIRINTKIFNAKLADMAEAAIEHLGIEQAKEN